MVQKTDARGVVANYTYDALNRVTSVSYPGNTAENTTFIYDATAGGNKGKGRLTGYSNISGNTALTYDSYGNITARTDTIGAASYTTGFAYDAANRLQSISYPSGRQVIYTRSALGRITQVDTRASLSDPAVTLVSSVTYRPFGPITGLTFANGVTTAIDYDTDYRTARITSNTVPAWDFSYSYDAASRITQQADQIGSLSRAYDYDALDRLISDSNPAGQWTYQYDANGNRTGRTWVHPDTSVTTLNPTISIRPA